MQRSLDEIGLLSLDPRERTLFKNSSIIPIGTCRTRPGYVLRYLATHHHHQPPPPAPTNLFNFLVSFLLWIQRETIVGSDLDLCVHVAGVEIFFYTIPLDDGENGSPTSPSTPHKEKKNKRETL